MTLLGLIAILILAPVLCIPIGVMATSDDRLEEIDREQTFWQPLPYFFIKGAGYTTLLALVCIGAIYVFSFLDSVRVF